MFSRTRAYCEVAAFCAATAAILSPASASAFTLKHTPSGNPVRWDSPNVAIAVDVSLASAAPGAVDAVASAASAWVQSPTAPAFTTAETTGSSTPAVDGINTVVFASKGYAPAKGALAVTLLSFDEISGRIVDADIVVNGDYNFGVLASTARANANAVPVSTEGGSGGGATTGRDEETGRAQFDLQHVITHELGHALGLGDETVDTSALMYAYTKPGDASVRAPVEDDVAGTSSLYPTAPTAPAPAAGCGANVAGAPLRSTDHWVAFAEMLFAGAFALSRRKARVVVPFAAAAIVFFGASAPAHSSPNAHLGNAAYATGKVVSVSTVNHDGVFESTVEIAPRSCRAAPCPSRARAHVWGGSLGGITQVVGETLAPREGDEVDVTLQGLGAEMAEAEVVTVRPLSP